MKRFFFLLFFLAATMALFSQTPDHAYFAKRHELYFKFDNPGRVKIEAIGRILSIDNVTPSTVYAYANEKEFLRFLEMNIAFTPLPHPGDGPGATMSSSLEEIKAWDTYPTYDAYVQMMTQFQAQFPALCKIHEIGTTVQGRKLLAAKISDNVEMNEPEPNFLFTSSIHGDETTGYVLMLRLIDYLLNNYSTDQQVAKLVNGLQIFINPLGNPDGTYRGGNSSVTGATRSNANNVDMNRNFADPAAGPHPDGNAYQPEVVAMMNFGKKYQFFLSANFHGGAEVLNYPWDTWSRLHPDDSWLVSVSRAFADTVHRYSPASYLSFLNNGITNGYAWYRITGGRQDYFTYFLNGREITMEISNTKLLPAAQLPAHWGYLYRSFLYYMENALYGIRGVITNTLGQPIRAKVFIAGRDVDSSFIFSDSATGAYVRMISPGTYTLTVSSPGHVTKTIPNVTVVNRTTTPLNIQLEPTGTPAGITWQSGITVTDNGGDNQSMVFGLAPTATDGIDLSLGEISLPPLPPTGVFDTRFELPISPPEFSHRDYRRDTLRAGQWKLRFQPGGGGYPVTVTWGSTALPAGTFYLKDAITGTIVNVNMKTQSSVVVTNTGINTLIIEYSKQTCANVAAEQGWSLISVPLTAGDMSVTAVFPQANSAAYAFNNGYVTASTLSTATGYWIRHPQSFVASVCGLPVSGNTVPLNAGWNLIGAYLNEAAVSGITTSPAGIINSAFFGYNNGYVNASSLIPGKGYWVRASAAGVMNLPAATFKAGTESVSTLPQSKIILRDAAGKSSTLYLSTGMPDEIKYELPPVPPSGIFDARFSTQSAAASLSTGSRTILISGAEYPVTMSTEECAISARDAATGGKLVNFSLASGTTVSIDNPAINSIEISVLTVPAKFSLGQNYPNPFNPVTAIQYQVVSQQSSVSSKSMVSLKVFDALGREVATVVNEEKPAGRYTVSFNASSLPSGTYFYELRAGDYREIKKMVVLK